MTRLATLILAVLTCVAYAGPAHALEIRITADARLEATVSGAGTVAQVAGALRDDLNRGLPQREVLVRIDARRTGQTMIERKVRTDSRGRFGLQEELPPGDYEVYVHFDKTDHLGASEASHSLRLDPAPVDVRAYAPAFVYGTKHPAWLSARANSGSVPYQGFAEVFIGERSVGRLELDASGRGTFDIAPHLSVGDNAIRVRTPGSAYRDEAEASVDVRFANEVTVEASLDEQLKRLQRGLAVSGVVRDSSGPLESVRVVGRIQAITVFDEEPIQRAFSATAITDEDGRFTAFVPATKLVDGVWSGEAEFLPPLGDGVKAAAGTTEIDTRAYRFAVNGFGIIALLLGALLLIGRLGQSLLARLRQWRKKREQEARQAAALEEVEKIVPVFLETDAGSSIEISRDDIGGVVWDVWQKEPIGGANVELHPAGGGEPMVSTTTDRGRFRFADVPPGNWRVVVRRFGFIRGEFALAVPHDGRLSNFRVDLVAVPLKIRRLYGSVVERSVGEDLWGQLSPRQIEERLDAIWPADGPIDRREIRKAVAQRLAVGETAGLAVLAALTEVVEESYFSGREYGEEAFLFARTLVLQLQTQQRPEPPAEAE